MDKYYIPKSIDEPFRIYLLTIDEFLLLLLPILIFGFVLNQVMLGLLVGISALFAIKKFKGEQGHFYLANLAYWYLPPIIKFKATPHSCIRHYLG